MAVLLAVTGAAAVNAGGVPALLSAKVQDALLAAAPRPAGETAVPVRTVLIDQASLDTVGPWPWPRTVLADLVQRLQDSGAALIVADLPLTKPDPTSPEEIARAWDRVPDMDDARTALRLMAPHDAVLAAAMARGPVVLGLEITDSGAPLPGARATVVTEGVRPAETMVMAVPGLAMPADSLAGPAAGLGVRGGFADPDGVSRTLPFALRAGTSLRPSLAMEALRLAENAPQITIRTGESGRAEALLQPPAFDVVAGARTMTAQRQGLRLWPAAAPAQTLSAVAFLNGEARPPLQGAIVVIGTDRPFIDGPVLSPQGTIARAQLTAAAIEQMLAGAVLTRPDFVLWAERGAALGLGLVAIAAGLTAPLWASLLLALAAAAIPVTGAFAVLGAQGWLVDPLWPSAAILLAYAAASAIRLGRRASVHALFEGATMPLLPPAHVEALAGNPGRIRLSGETRDVTVLHCTVRGFAGLASAARERPDELTRRIRDVMSAAARIVVRSNGVIERFTADGFVAVWNGPVPESQHAVRACDAALKLLEALDRIEDSGQSRSLRAAQQRLALGIGIATGDAILGDFGTRERTVYAATGPAPAEAAMLACRSALYGPAIAVAEGVRQAGGRHFAFLTLDAVRPDGAAEPMRVFALLGTSLVAATPRFKVLADAHATFFDALAAHDWAGARERLTAARAAGSALPPALYALYEGRLAALERAQPHPYWDGVWDEANMNVAPVAPGDAPASAGAVVEGAPPAPSADAPDENASAAETPADAGIETASPPGLLPEVFAAEVTVAAHPETRPQG